MSNYRWLIDSTDAIPRKESISLRGNTFESLVFPKILISLMDELLEKELRSREIHLKVDDECPDFYYLIPEELQYVSISAPLYRQNSETGIYEKLSDSYTATAINPEQQAWVKNSLTRSKSAVSQAQASKFQELFNKNTLDKGITACINIASSSHNIGNLVYEKYIPNTFFAICQLSPNFDGIKQVFFMRKINASGKIVIINVPKHLRGAVIGIGGQNIWQFAKKINASKIRVI